MMILLWWGLFIAILSGTVYHKEGKMGREKNNNDKIKKRRRKRCG
jgi:hypothetical protein